MQACLAILYNAENDEKKRNASTHEIPMSFLFDQQGFYGQSWEVSIILPRKFNINERKRIRAFVLISVGIFRCSCAIIL